MPRESIITIYRSIDPTIPTGLTFGEFGFAGANRQLFIGGTGGGATVESIWIGASITGDDISTSDGWAGGTGAYRVSTTDAVKRYVDAIAGTKGEVASINGDTGIITITGAGNSAAVSVRSTIAGTHLIDARVATTSLTGVAYFNVAHFNITSNGGVSLKQGTTFTVRGSDDSNDTIGLTGTLTLTGSGAIRINVNDGAGGGNNATVTFDPRIATASLTGIASFPSSFFTVSATGAVNLASAYQVTGDTVVQGGASQLFTRSGNQVTIDNRVATASVTGVASFPSSFFTVSTTGAVNLAAAYQVTGHTVVQGGPSQLVSTVGNTTTIDNRVATTGVTGVASFPSSFFTVSTTGAVNLAAAYQVTGHTVVSGGSSQFVSTVNNTTTIDNKLATINGQTGVAAFTSNFQISPNGTVDLANDITIAGNLTVQGTVVTSNVDNFTVQDTLIKLGTGNTNVGSAYDLGLYMQYPAAGTNNIRLAGFFLDYQDTKFKLFTGLTASAQDGTTGTDQAAQLHADRQGYTVATLIAKLDGGTF